MSQPDEPLGAGACLSNEAFIPHVCGPLDVNAMVRVLGFRPQPDGTFVLPAHLEL
jgi:uncharacterized protein (DUF952 family)